LSLGDVSQFHIPSAVIDKTDAALRSAGTRRLEAFVLWTGETVGETFEVRKAHIPEQTSYRLESGLCVRVDGAELHRLNAWLYQNRQELGAQVHSHPTEAYHSETDDTFPIVTVRGALSVVVPDFGRRGIRGPGIAAYRLTDDGWDELGARARDHVLVMAH
jgi:hypothetical protein